MSKKEKDIQAHMPSAEEVARELGKAKSIDDFYGKDGIFSRLFSKTIEEMLEAELTTELGYERYEVEGRNSGNSRNGYYTRKMRTSGGDAEIKVPRDRNGEFQSALPQKNSNEIEQKLTAMYAKGMSTRDIQELLTELYGIDVSPETISAITNKVWPLVEGWQNRRWQRSTPCYTWTQSTSSSSGMAGSTMWQSITCWALIWTATEKFSATGLVTVEKVPTSGSQSSPTCKIAACRMYLLPPSMD